MTGLIDTVLAGVLLGGIYALFALGLSLIFGIMRLVNLAHGDLILLAAYLVLTVTTALGVPLAVATVVIVAAMFALGFILQRLVLERVLGDDILPPLLVTFGLSIVIQNGLLLVYGADSRRLQAGAFESSSIARARTGRRSRAADGIDPGDPCGRASAGGVLSHLARPGLPRHRRQSANRAIDGYRPPQHLRRGRRDLAGRVRGRRGRFRIRANFDPSIGPARLLYAFEAVIIGGLGSLWGTLAGGIVLGLAQTIGARIDPEWQILAGHLAFLAVLMVRPRGLFPSRRP